jgi:ribosome-associated translation inhibitor RaiA
MISTLIDTGDENGSVSTIEEERKDMRTIKLPIEFNQEVPSFPQELRRQIERSLENLAKDHKDVTGASITLSQPAHGGTPYLFRASIVVYMRPENVYAEHKSETLEVAVRDALEAIERQVREERKKRGEPWKRHDLNPDQNSPHDYEEGEDYG